MPTYDYECTECGYSFEYFQSMSDDPLTVCPQCGGKVRRLIGSGLGVIFKGSGFYVTDNRKSSSTITGTKKESAPEKLPEKSLEKSGEKNTKGSSQKADSGKADSKKKGEPVKAGS